jgi:hypothetical protein
MPWRRTRPIHPENTPAVTEPIAMLADSHPKATVDPSNRSAAIWGNRARGIANAMAMMSTAKDIITMGLLTM